MNNAAGIVETDESTVNDADDFLYEGNIKRAEAVGFIRDPLRTLYDNACAADDFLAVVNDAKRKGFVPGDGMTGPALKAAAEAFLAAPPPAPPKAAAPLKLATAAPMPTMADLVLSAADLAAREIPPRENLITPFLRAGSVNMLYARRGVGKTMLALEMAHAVAAGAPFLSYPVPKARPVLVIDGEMGEADLKERMGRLFAKQATTLKLLTAETIYRATGRWINLADPGDQADILKVITACDPSLIVVDNLSSLCRGVDENDNGAWDMILPFLLTLKTAGRSVLLVHHAGKNGDQRGASRREDHLDTVLRLDADEGTDGAAFTIRFTKCRGYKRPVPLRVELVDGGEFFAWKHAEPDGTSRKSEKTAQVLQAIQSGTTKLDELAGKVGVSTGYVSKLLNSLREEGYLHPGKGVTTLTTKGMAFLGLS